MSDAAPRPHKKTSLLEHAQYWRDVRHETWELSKEQFQIHHGVIVAVLALLIRWYFLGWKAMIDEIIPSLFYVVAPVGLYLVGLYVVNFFRAMVRVPVHYQREITRLTDEIAQMKAPQLQLELPEAELNFTSTKTVVFVRVRNLTALTIENVLVRIASIEKIDGPEDTKKLPPPLRDYVGLPLSIRDAGAPSPHGYAPHEAAIHAEDSAAFDTLLIQSTHLTLLHAKRAAFSSWVSLKEPQQTWWIRSPEANLPLGHYRIQLKAQGRNTPPAMLTIEVTQSDNKRTVQQLEEVVPRGTNSTVP